MARRCSYTSSSSNERGVDGRTKLELLMQVSSKEVRDTILSTGMETGIQEQMLILDEILAEG